MEDPQFLFATCQLGAETALKREFARVLPGARLAFSRPGFLTFKLSETIATQDLTLPSTFARAYGFSRGQLAGALAAELAERLWPLVEDLSFQHLHVWQRDQDLPGQGGFEPGETPLAREIGALIAARRASAGGRVSLNRRAHVGDTILDCVVVEPGHWWIGFHQATSVPSRWPGGVIPAPLPDHAVSRAYAKTVEALRWSRFPIRRGDRCVEIGSAPGGSCQALLDRGLLVCGIDPSDMDRTVLAHPHFTHVKKRGADLKRREYRGFRWLTADLNVAPNYTLETVENIVTHRDVHIRGLLLTLKLLDWDLADEIPNYLRRVRGWGFEYVRARQLARNRREICLAALRHRSQRRPPRNHHRSPPRRP